MSLAICGAALADTVSSESSVGIQSGYNSNPLLESSGAHAAESVAVLANLPVTYTSDTQSFDLVPRLRYGETHGPEALLSNYEYLDAVWRINHERDTFTIGADWHHDSTFYNPFENAALFGRSLRREEEIANLEWKRDLSERSALHVTGSWDKVAYSQASVTGLENFTYGQGLLKFDHALSERWTWTNSAGVGRYALMDGSYRSDSRFVESALKRALSERWSIKAEVGYSYLSSHEQGYVCCRIALGPGGFFLQPILLMQSASRGSPNYAVSVERQGARVMLSLTASRTIQPSGLGALLTQDDVSLAARMPWTERWSVAATLHGSRLSDSLQQLNFGDRRYADFELDAIWLWTEHWTLQLQGIYTIQRVLSTLPAGASTQVTLTLMRQFGHIRL